MEGVSDSRVYAYYSNYKPSGAVGQVSHVNGTTDYRYYDPFTMRITSIRTTSVLGDLQYWSYGYTPAGDIEEIHNIVTDVTYDYTYDELHRLLSETSDGAYPTINYTYNVIGNIMSKTYGANSYAYTYDTTRKHAVANINFNGNNYAYTYDGNGNMTAGPDFTDPTQTATRAITYNADNLPTNIAWTKAATVTSAFTYDGSGTRVKKTIQGGSTTWYIGSHYEKKDSTYTKYIFAGGTRIAKVTTSGYHILHSDHLGSSTIITESSGGVVESTEYNPFGTTRTHSGATLTNYKYTDQELDPETGLYNYGARYYDPMIGRFISPDPIVQAPFNPQSLNRYSYCINSPLMYVDPSGYFSLGSFFKSLFTGIIGGAVFVLSGGTAAPVFAGIMSGMAAGAAGVALNGGNLGQVLQGAIIGAALGGLGGGLYSLNPGFVYGMLGAGAAFATATGGLDGLAYYAAGIGGGMIGYGGAGYVKSKCNTWFGDEAFNAGSNSPQSGQDNLCVNKDPVVADSNVRAAMDKAWNESNPGQANAREQGGWIINDTNGYNLDRWPTGNQGSITPTTPVPSGTVASFHTHPNIGPVLGKPGFRWVPEVPSSADFGVAQYFKLPGYIKWQGGIIRYDGNGNWCNVP